MGTECVAEVTVSSLTGGQRGFIVGTAAFPSEANDAKRRQQAWLHICARGPIRGHPDTRPARTGVYKGGHEKMRGTGPKTSSEGLACSHGMFWKTFQVLNRSRPSASRLRKRAPITYNEPTRDVCTGHPSSQNVRARPKGRRERRAQVRPRPSLQPSSRCSRTPAQAAQWPGASRERVRMARVSSAEGVRRPGVDSAAQNSRTLFRNKRRQRCRLL